MSKWKASFLGTVLAISGWAQSLGEIENPKVDSVAEKLNCPCGCKLNMACKMEPWPCGTCRKAKIKIAEMQKQGKSDQQILDQFVAEGTQPVVPPGIWGTALSYSALAIGLALVVLVIRRYSRPRPAAAGGPPVDPAVLASIEKDTANLD